MVKPKLLAFGLLNFGEYVGLRRRSRELALKVLFQANYTQGMHEQAPEHYKEEQKENYIDPTQTIRPISKNSPKIKLRDKYNVSKKPEVKPATIPETKKTPELKQNSAPQDIFNTEDNTAINTPHLATAEELLNSYLQSFAISPEEYSYCECLVSGVIKNLKEIDSIIQSHSKNWLLNRMPSVDLNIMRIATFEAKHGIEKLDKEIIINEAIELAKVFCEKDSPSFINGVLDQITKSQLV